MPIIVIVGKVDELEVGVEVLSNCVALDEEVREFLIEGVIAGKAVINEDIVVDMFVEAMDIDNVTGDAVESSKSEIRIFNGTGVKKLGILGKLT